MSMSSVHSSSQNDNSCHVSQQFARMSLNNTSTRVPPRRPPPPPPPSTVQRRPCPPTPEQHHQQQQQQQQQSAMDVPSVGMGVDYSRVRVVSQQSHQSSALLRPIAYEVTPPRQRGPTEAEMKVEALTKEIEREMEMKSQNTKDFFGVCHTCGEKVLGVTEACQAMGQLFHTLCFTCCSCGRPLRGRSFYNVSGKIYCEEDYLYCGFHQTAERCAACGHLIVETILQALGKSFHPGCFRCHHCNDCLDGVPFTVDVENRVFCVEDYHALFAPKCSACAQAIVPLDGSEETVRVVSMDKSYHIDCYCCDTCQIQLTDGTCFPLNGRLLCLQCHVSAVKAS